MEHLMRYILRFLLILPLAILLMGMDSAAPEADERTRFLEREEQLTAKIDSLRREQEFLLFQKALTGSDSKYLVLDLAAGKGKLLYRNRTLRTFDAAIPASLRKELHEGRYVVTSRSEGTPKERTLVFQDAFALRGKGFKGAQAGEKRLPVMTLARRDMAAIVYSLDIGSMIYIRK